MLTDEEKKIKHELDIEQIRANIEKLRADTTKSNKELKWYEVTLIIAFTLALVAVVKLFM